MRFIDLENNPPPQKWIDNATMLTQKLIDEPGIEEKKKIIEKHSGEWGKIKAHLLSLSHGKCWYSEAKEIFSHYHVDHYRPKKKVKNLDKSERDGGYWWKAFDWTNYRIMGGVGNTKKSDYFPVKNYPATCHTDSCDDELCYFLDPIDKDDTELLTFDESGIPQSINSDENSWDYERVQVTIKYYNLKYGLLVDARKEIWTLCVRRIWELQNLMDDYNKNPSVTLRERVKNKTNELRDMIKVEAELSSTAKACLQSSGIPWAIKLASN